MEFKEIVMKRYAAKKFDGRMIDEKKVGELLEMVRYAASSFGLQPWKIKIITDKETKEKLQAASWNQPQVSTCSHLLVFCAETRVDNLIEKYESYMKKAGVPQENITGYIGMMKGWASGLSEEKKVAWAQRQVYIAMANALNGAKALGFDSCPMEGFSAQEYSKILSLPEHLIPTVVVPIGYAADSPRPKLRFAKEEVVF